MPNTLLKSARVFHLYSGVFFTPALLFFAFTGAVQSMNWHEVTRGRDYKPPAILVKLAQLHKKETLVLPERRPEPSAAKIEASIGPAPAKSPFDPTRLGDHTNQQKHDNLDRPRSNESLAPAPLPAPAPRPPTQQKTPKTLPLKIFSFLAGAGLFLSTLTGLYMAYRYANNKAAITGALLTGLLLPLLLLALQ